MISSRLQFICISLPSNGPANSVCVVVLHPNGLAGGVGQCRIQNWVGLPLGMRLHNRKTDLEFCNVSYFQVSLLTIPIVAYMFAVKRMQHESG